MAKKKWTKEAILESTKGYEYLAAWHKDYAGAYWSAKEQGLFEICCGHLKKYEEQIKRTIWTKENLQAKALQYSTRSEWHFGHHSSYSTAHKLGLLDELCRHMKRSTGVSKDEAALRCQIMAIYPSAQKKRFRHLSGNKTGCRFELDIYVPELNKGIEFNGTYWHSLEGLRRKRPYWTDEQIQNYHSTKKEFFQSIGVSYLDISDKDWNASPEFCIQKALAFLAGP